MFEAYKIGVTLSLTNHVSKGLLLMAGDFAKTEAQASALQKRIQGIQSMALKGGLMLGAGVGMLALFKTPLDEAKKFEQQMGKFKLFGMSDAQNSDALRFAKNMNIMGSSARENLKLMTEAQGVFRESGAAGPQALDGAKIAAPYLAKIAFAAGTFDEETAAKMRTASMSMLRYIEMSGGLQSPQKFNELANAGWKLTQTSGGAVNFEQLRQFKARAAISGQYMTEEGMAMMEPLIAELKGSTAGFAARTAFNRLNGIIKIPNQASHALMTSGIWDASKVALNSQGGIKSFNGNPLKDSALMMQNPVAFYEKNFKPMYDKANMSPEERGRNNAMYFGSTGGMLYTLIDKQLATIHHSLDSYRKAKGIDDSYGMAGKTLAGKEIDMHAKWRNLMLELGTSVLPLAVKALETLIPMVKGLTGWIEQNRTAVKLLAGAFGLLATGLMVRGAVLLLTAAFGGLSFALNVMALGQGGGLAALAATGVLRLGVAIRALVSSQGVFALASGLGALGVKIATLIGPGSLLVGAGLVGYGVGSVIHKSIEGTKADDTIGYLATRVAAFAGSEQARQTLRITSGGKLYQDWAKSVNAPGIKPLVIPAATSKPVGVLPAAGLGVTSPKYEAVNSVAPNNGNIPISVTTQVNLDGRKVAENTTEHQSRAASKPQSGRGGVDRTMMPYRPGAAN